MDPASLPRLYTLPNEVFVQIFTPFSTRDLLPLTTVSRRFHALILRILHYRLLVSASLKEYKLILECFHPASKLVEPHVFCKYLGTDGLSDQYEGKGSLYEDVDEAQRLGRLSSLYSRFRPEATVEEQSIGVRLLSSWGIGGGSREDNLLVTRPIHLEVFENFSQLCIVVNIVKVIPGSSLLLSAVTVEDEVVRLFQDWLQDAVRRREHLENHNDPYSRETTEESDADIRMDGSQMLWVDQARNVGLKVRVREKREVSEAAPILVHRDEEPATSFELAIEELHVRTTRLLTTMEKSLEEQQNHSKAMIFTPSLG
ncbi:F-box protein [Aspergillus candidus]|uniref:F-box domain-containing protein n=1 Tax=Aspergillus candidus TaxID=41067 RepID=A0A2I2F0Q5_ASPCN|nr:hypothetical protein BDW47DRAFT_80018 [Aspergillus candidus]PLB34176.1 hypothetical protein BDW47DRAFT_80018 [Aspergillus candidus]